MQRDLETFLSQEKARFAFKLWQMLSIGLGSSIAMVGIREMFLYLEDYLDVPGS